MGKRTLKIEVDHADLVCLVMGCMPPERLFNSPLLSPYGRFVGGFYDRWEWSPQELKKLTEEHLLSIYQLSKT